MSFAEAAARLAGIAGSLLGWRPEDFWTATPAELAQIFAALREGAGESAPLEPEKMEELIRRNEA